MGYEAVKTFELYEFYYRKFEVNITVPYFLPTDTPGVGGIVTANYTTGMGVLGYARVVVRARDMSSPYDPRGHPLTDVEFDRSGASFITKIDDFNGVAGFFIPIATIRTLVPDLDGKEILITAVVHDPWWNETNNGKTSILLEASPGTLDFLLSGTTVVSFYTPGTRLRFLGGPSMVFKPRMLFTTYVAAANSDGTKFPPGPNRYIRIYTESDFGQTQPPADYILDASSIVRHQFLAPGDPNIAFIRLRAELYDNNVKVQGSDDEQRAIRYLSPSNSYLQVTSSTENPRVGDFMLFRVNITQYVDSVYFHITSAGRLIFTNILPMDGARQKTFDVGVSREMAPSAHILVYYIRYDGEIVADSMNFHVNTSSVTNQVNITINRRKDFTGNTIEVLAYASPQSFVAFAGLGLVQSRLYPPGNFFSPVMVSCVV
jgi:CD109 antigen